MPSASLKLLNLNQGHSSKKSDFSGQILVKLIKQNKTSLIEMLQLSNFGHMTASTT